jgi:hypothetical protein
MSLSVAQSLSACLICMQWESAAWSRYVAESEAPAKHVFLGYIGARWRAVNNWHGSWFKTAHLREFTKTQNCLVCSDLRAANAEASSTNQKLKSLQEEMDYIKENHMVLNMQVLCSYSFLCTNVTIDQEAIWMSRCEQRGFELVKRTPFEHASFYGAICNVLDVDDFIIAFV